MGRTVAFAFQDWPLKAPFRIARGTASHYHCVNIQITQDGYIGRGEGRGIYYLGETDETIAAQLGMARPAVEAGCGREELRALLPPGAARNALDGALWDLDARREGKSVADQLGLEVQPLPTFYTLSVTNSPGDMAEKARAASTQSRLKIKLGTDDPAAMVEAVRRVRPDADIVVDANQSLVAADLPQLIDALAACEITMLEQPVAPGQEAVLADLKAPFPICADESCQSLADLETLPIGYDMINIKLDKCGGLTEALHMVSTARARGLKCMVGNMLGTSLAMAPAYLLAQMCDLADLDGPLLLADDYPGGLRYEAGWVHGSSPGFWGENGSI